MTKLLFDHATEKNNLMNSLVFGAKVEKLLAPKKCKIWKAVVCNRDIF